MATNYRCSNARHSRHAAEICQVFTRFRLGQPRLCRESGEADQWCGALSSNDPQIVGQSQHYLRDFSQIAAEETTVAGIVGRMVERYPDWENLRTVWHSARPAVARNG